MNKKKRLGWISKTDITPAHNTATITHKWIE